MITRSDKGVLSNFDSLMQKFDALQPKRHIVVVSPSDEPTQAVIRYCASNNLAKFTITIAGDDAAPLKGFAKQFGDNVKLLETSDLDEAAALGVKLVRSGQGDVLMKGGINTDRLLKAVLNKEYGLLPKGRVLSHLTLTHIPSYHKMLMFMDAAVIPAPDLEQFTAMLRYGIDSCHKLGVDSPRVALIHFSEKVNSKFRHTLDYETMLAMASQGEFGNVVLDGPMDVKTACDKESAGIKGIDSPVAGETDLLIFPNLPAANTFYKTISLFCNAPMAGVLCGTIAPVVIPSRADHDSSKLYSLALACLLK